MRDRTRGLGWGRATGMLLVLTLGCSDRSLPLSPPGPEEPVDPEPYAAGIHVAGADGSNARYLVDGERPAWSPDGRRIAFQRDGSIYIIGRDGTGEIKLGLGREPAWAPDGVRLAFSGNQGIAVMQDDGSGVRTVLPHDFRRDTDPGSDQGAGKPAWSPDGKRIAFEHRGDGDLSPAQVYVMNADGSQLRRVSPTQGYTYAQSDPAWSPDGSEILLWGFGYGIIAVPANGGTVRPIYDHDPAVAYGAKPAPSPDGRTILFNANQFTLDGQAIWRVGSGAGPRGWCWSGRWTRPGLPTGSASPSSASGG